MAFNSLVFLCFFAFALLLHFARVPWKIRKFNLLWLSYVFYAAWNPPFVVLLWVSTLADWFIAKRLAQAERVLHRRVMLGLSLFVNLGMLTYFKYGEFAAENFAALLGLVGFDWEPASMNIALPLGISFYTFQTLSYTLDVYAKRITPWTSFLDYALFVTFFPQLVAGPIVRARQFLPQCMEPPVVTARQFGWGMYLFVIGLFQKSVIADVILAPTVETVFDSPGAPGFVDGWIGGMSFLCQVFCDFAGYSSCAIGIALCLGFRLPINFRFPLASIGFAELWTRWHISLSTWLRDYVYYTLGGSRVSPLRFAFNILFTWSLIGLWHGAAWRFVLWGLINGFWIVCERAACSVAPKSSLWTKTPVQFGFAVIQFTGFSLACLAFRAQEFDRLMELAAPMFGVGPMPMLTLLTPTAATITASAMAAMFLWHWFMRDESFEHFVGRLPWWFRSGTLVFMLVAILVARGEDRAFIYFQF